MKNFDSRINKLEEINNVSDCMKHIVSFVLKYRENKEEQEKAQKSLLDKYQEMGGKTGTMNVFVINYSKNATDMLPSSI
jgi:hypothetical protein